MKRFSFKSRSGSKGQSFVELSLVVFLLMELVAGIAEFGVLLNRYLNLVDGAREAARFGANTDPFAICVADSSGHVATSDSDGICPNYYQSAAAQATQVLKPYDLNPALGDDIVISVIVVTPTAVCRYPTYDFGWSYRKYFDGFSSGNQSSAQQTADITAKMNEPNSTPVSMIMVEIFYHYPQTLKAPFYEQLFPDPVPVYTYSIMPLKNVSPPSGLCH
jgi:hypothetical protein